MRWKLRRSELPAREDGLTPREEMLFYFLLWHAVHDRPLPTYRQIAKGMGYGSKNSISVVVWRFRQAGYITGMDSENRNICKPRMKVRLACLRPDGREPCAT